MIICSSSNIDLIQGVSGYGTAADGATDWRIENTPSGVFNILNSPNLLAPNVSIIDVGNVGIGTIPITGTNKLQIQGATSVSGLITANAGITASGLITANTLTASGLITANTLTASGLITANTLTASGLITANAGITVNTGSLTCANDTISKTYTATNTTAGANDILTMRYDNTNGIRFLQTLVAANDVRYDLIQKTNNVDYTAPVISFYKGNVGIGTNNPSTSYKLNVTGDVNISGGYFVGGSALTIPYFNLTNKITAGNGISLTPGSASTSPSISTNLTAGNGISISAAASPTISTNLTAGNGISISAAASPTISTNLTAGVGISISAAASPTISANISAGTGITFTPSGNNISISAGASSQWQGATGANIYYNSANVGIGTNNPLILLDVNGSLLVRAAKTGTGGSQGIFFREGYTSTSQSYNCSILTYDHNGDNFADGLSINGEAVSFCTGADTRQERMRIANNGNVAIGTTTTNTHKLNVSGNVNVSSGYLVNGDAFKPATATLSDTATALANSRDIAGVSFNGSSSISIPYFNLTNKITAGNGISLTTGSASSSPTISSSQWTTTGNNIFYNTGGVGIGVSSLVDNLVSLQLSSALVVGATIQAFNAFYFPIDIWNMSNEGKARLYFVNSGTTHIRSGLNNGRQIEFRKADDTSPGYFNSDTFFCYGPNNLSDSRIKRDIEEINDETALNMLLLVQPTTYYYRDEARNKGNGKVYGFIAQQIKEVIPDAVSITKDIIANIYKTCLVYNKREIYHSIPQDVEIDTEVQIYDKKGGEKGTRYKIKEIYEDHFVIDEDIEGDDCFVFGYCVNDLHGLDKSYIFTLNVCATQELYRRIEAQSVLINSQDFRIKDLESKVAMLMSNM